MSANSPTELLILHAVRLLGFGDTDAVAARAGIGRVEALAHLQNDEDKAWVQYLDFAGLAGWSLTDTGKVENERQLAVELAAHDPDCRVAAAYRDFLPLNSRLVQAVTDWQINPTQDDPFAFNNHADEARDNRILMELEAIGSGLEPIERQISEVLSRFDGYSARYASALRKGTAGEHDWIDKSDVDSCHRVWFELHEDLIATLGIDRRG